MPAAGWVKMTEKERALAQRWYDEGKSPSTIAELLDRDTSTLTRLLCKQEAAKKQGRPSALTKAQVDYLERKLDQMIVKADGQKMITVEALQKATKTKAGTQTILKALHERDIYFRKLREKPVLTPADVKARKAFASTYRHKSRAWWLQHVHAFIDGKYFQAACCPCRRELCHPLCSCDCVPRYT